MILLPKKFTKILILLRIVITSSRLLGPILKQKAAAQCCRSAKFGGAQAKQGRALATLCLVRFLSKFGFRLLVSKGNYTLIAILIKDNDERPYGTILH